jgi:hypothetical protein
LLLKVASNIGSNINLNTSCTILSVKEGKPNGLVVFFPGFGI